MTSTSLWLPHRSGKLVQAELIDEVTQSHLNQWRELWLPAQRRLEQNLEEAGVPRREWPQHLHWDWENKIRPVAGLLSYRSLCIRADDALQALALLNTTTKRGRHPDHDGLDVVYVEFLEVAPWNLKMPGREGPAFTGLGTTLMKAAIEISLDIEFKGRVALHSLPQSADFYRKIGMAELGNEQDHQGLCRYEFTESAASTFLDEGNAP